MKRLRSIAIWSAALAITAGCRSNLGGMPTVGSPAWTQAAISNDSAAGLKLSERVMPSSRGVGSSNTITADRPVSHPDTKPCVVTLFHRDVFKNFNNQTFDYTPPADCPGPWAKVVFNFDVRVTKGVQYDRTAILWVGGAVIYFGTTSEPSNALAPHWHVARDVTDLSALFTAASEGQVELWNCYCPPTYNGYQIGKAYLQFYPPDPKYPAPRVPDEVIGLPYAPPLGNVATIPQTAMEFSGTLPTNITAAYADVYLQSQNKEEQWFMDVPDRVWSRSDHALGFSRGTAFREGEVTVNGKPAGVAPIYPWIYTGGMDPWLWNPCRACKRSSSCRSASILRLCRRAFQRLDANGRRRRLSRVRLFQWGGRSAALPRSEAADGQRARNERHAVGTARPRCRRSHHLRKRGRTLRRGRAGARLREYPKPDRLHDLRIRQYLVGQGHDDRRCLGTLRQRPKLRLHREPVRAAHHAEHPLRHDHDDADRERQECGFGLVHLSADRQLSHRAERDRI